MKNKNEIKEIIFVQQKDESKKLKIKIGEFYSGKLIKILKEITGRIFKVKKIILRNGVAVEVDNILHLKPIEDQQDDYLLFESKNENFIVYLRSEQTKLLRQMLVAFEFIDNKLIPKKIKSEDGEDKYLIGKDSYRINGLVLNGEVIMRNDISLYTIDLKLCHWKYNKIDIELQGIILENVTKSKITFEEIKGYDVVIDSEGIEYNQLFYGKSYLLFPIMISGKYLDEIENFDNIGYYLSNIYKMYMSEEIRN